MERNFNFSLNLVKKEVFIIYTLAFLFGILIYKVNPIFGLFSIPFIFLRQIKLIPLFVFMGLLAFFIREQNLKLPLIEAMEEATITGKVEKIYFKGKEIRAVVKTQAGYKLIASFKKEEPIKIGESLEISGLLIPLPKKIYPTFYDVEMKNRFLKIIGYISVKNYVSVKQDYSLLEKVRSYTLNTLSNFKDEKTKAVAIALLLGDKGKIPQEVYTQFKTAGLAHILAISGLHMSITIILFFGIFWKLFALTPLCLIYNTRRIASIIGILFGVFYLFLSSFPVSGVRSFIMICTLFSFYIFGRGANGIRALCISLFIILLLAPEEVLFPSFQLSFSAVLCLLYAYKFKLDIKNFTGRLINAGVATIISSFLITFITIPIVVHHFNYVHFYGALFNLIAIPFLSIIVMPLALFNVLTAGWLHAPFEAGINALFALTKLSLNLPLNSVFMPYFNGYLVSIYCFGLVFLLCFESKMIKIFGGIVIIASLSIYLITAKMPKIVVNEDFLVIKSGKNYISVFKIPDGFLKQIWSQNLNSSFINYKDASNIDFKCNKGACIKPELFTIIYNDFDFNIKCEGNTFINMYSDFIPSNCNAEKIITHSDLIKHNPTPFIIY